MRFVHIKHKQNCNYCGAILNPGEEAVVIRIKHRNGAVIPIFFHTNQCYERWNTETFINRLLNWRMSATERPKRKKMGRPVKYFIPYSVAQRLRCLLNYHKGKGHDERVEELRKKLIECEVKQV